MSRLWVEGPEPHWVTYTERVVCDGCERVTLERNHGPDHRERPFSTNESGGATFTRGRGAASGEGLLIDFCEDCSRVIEDVIRERLKRVPVAKTVALSDCRRCEGRERIGCPRCEGSGFEPQDFSKEPL
jgi:hypothetical protein